ncbi:hypothetical protein NB311A_04948 [Nitrobacter sp. Nb-311A]|nr:hypothetical protein NB311A_04948 [Nitrobacter sp. Nb-311A]
MNDSATMNIWLHKQMMAQPAANGGKLLPILPAQLSEGSHRYSFQQEFGKWRSVL